jgi:ankyrin repeat protein
VSRFPHRHTEALKLLLRSGEADILSRNRYDEMPLEVAIVQGASRRYHECASILRPLTLELGVHALADKSDSYIISAMDRLAITSEAMAGEAEAEGGEPAHVPIALELICAYLRVAAIHGDMRTIKELGDSLVVNVGDHKGRTPLHHACIKGNMGIAAALIQRNADIHQAASDGSTALHMAAENDKFLVVKLLLKHGADVEVLDLFGRTPLEIARANSPMSTKLIEEHVPMEATMLSKLEDVMRVSGLEGSTADVDKMAAALGLTLAASGLAGKIDELHRLVMGDAPAKAPANEGSSPGAPGSSAPERRHDPLDAIRDQVVPQAAAASEQPAATASAAVELK